MLDEDNVDGTMVYLASNGYNQWNTASASSCRISVPQGATLSVTIYDFLSNTSNGDCSARLLVTNDKTTTVCAQAPWKQEVLNYDATPSGQTVDFLMQQTDSTVVSKLLILLQGKNSFDHFSITSCTGTQSDGSLSFSSLSEYALSSIPCTSLLARCSTSSIFSLSFLANASRARQFNSLNPPWGGVGTASSNKYGSRGRSCVVVRGRSCAVVRGRAPSCAVVCGRACVVGHAWLCVVVRGGAWSCAVGRAWSCVFVRGRAWSCAVVRGRARSCVVVRGRARSCVVGHAWSVMRGRSCVVVRGSAWSCVVVRGRARSVVRGRARSCVRGRSFVVARGRAWSCAVGRAWSCAVGRARSRVVVRSCRSARFAASTAMTQTNEGKNERTNNI